MPDLQSQAALFRKGNYRYTGYMTTIPQTVVFSRAVNMTTITYPVTEITFDDPYSGTGSTSDVFAGMTIFVYDGNTDTLKGRLRVAVGGASGSTIEVNEFSEGTLYLENNDRFDVIDEFYVWDALRSNDGLFNPDSRLAYTDQTDLYAPVANAGGAWVGHVDAGQTFATVQFDAGDSFTVDPDSAGTLTYLWNFRDGTITVGTTTSQTVTVTFPIGFRHVILTVTDSSNSKSTTTFVPVRVHDKDSTPALSVAIDTLTITRERGGEAQFRLPVGSEAAIDNLPDRAQIFYWEDERYNDTSGSYGSNAPTGRDHIKHVGFLNADSLDYDAATNEVTFNSISPLLLLEQTAALPQLLIRDAAPDQWFEGTDVTVAVFIWYLKTYGAYFFFDFLYDDGRSFEQQRIAANNVSNLLAQLQDIAGAINLVVTCDRVGRLLFQRNPNYLSIADRNAKTTTYAFTDDDFISFQPRRNHRNTVKQVDGEGITDGVTVAQQEAVFSRAPGLAPGEGAGVEKLSGQIVENQEDLNVRTGNRFAEANGLFWNETDNTITRVSLDANLTLPSGYDVFDPAYLEYITITLSNTQRGVDYDTSNRWLVNGVTVTYDNEIGVKQVSAVIAQETHAPRGVTITKPETDDSGITISDPIDFDFDFEVPSLEVSDVTNLNPGVADMLLLGNGATWQTANWNTAAPNYTAQLFTSTAVDAPVGGDVVGECLTGAISVQDPNRLIFGTTDSLYEMPDTSAATRTAKRLYQFPARAGGGRTSRMVHHNIASPDYWQVVSTYNNFSADNGVYETHSTDDGVTWSTEAQISPNVQPQFFGSMIATVEVSPINPLTAYTWAPSSTVTSPYIQFNILRTTDGGVTWAIWISNAAFVTPGHMHIPPDNTQDVLWYGGWDDANISNKVLRNSLTTTSVNYAPIDPDTGKRLSMFLANTLHTAGNNRELMILGATDDLRNRKGAYISGDGGNTWTKCTQTTNNSATFQVRGCYLSGDGATAYVLGDDGQLPVIGVGSVPSLLSGSPIPTRNGNIEPTFDFNQSYAFKLFGIQS